MKIYLAGPINGCTDEECIDWRDQVKLICHPDIQIFDPMDRDYRGKEKNNLIDIVHGDKEDIHACDAVIANVNKPSWGTGMEIFWAWTLGIPTHAFMDDKSKASPWIEYHCRSLNLTSRFALLKARKEYNNA